jgi:hypothetical protein
VAVKLSEGLGVITRRSKLEFRGDEATQLLCGWAFNCAFALDHRSKCASSLSL